MITNNLDEALLLSDRIIPMTRGPRATLGSPVEVRLPRPRSMEMLLHDEQAVRARGHVVASLTGQLHSGAHAAGDVHASPATDGAALNAAPAEAGL
jgi:nitrate/nitrite transport system ATP-binding protein